MEAEAAEGFGSADVEAAENAVAVEEDESAGEALAFVSEDCTLDGELVTEAEADDLEIAAEAEAEAAAACA